MVISNIGTWMHDVTSAWLMTSLAPSPLMVSLVQAATTAPFFLFSYGAGALGDLVDRRRLLLATTALLALVTLVLALSVSARIVSPWGLLAFTFLTGAGAAFVAPAWQAIVPQLVPRDSLSAAVALNSIGVNVSRAVGPALAGVIIAAAGAAWPYLLNAMSYAVVLMALWWWRPPPRPVSHLPAERFRHALRSGFRFARRSPDLRATLGRAVAFFLFASAYWALLPLLVREHLGGGSALYGITFGAVGAGAVGAAVVLPRLRQRFGPDVLSAGASAGMVLVLAVLALVPDPSVAVTASLLAGGCWIAVLSSLNVSAQLSVPDWVRSRGLAIFITVFFGTMTLGSVIWGAVASAIGLPLALLAAAVCGLLGVLVSRRWRLRQEAGLDVMPSSHWPAPLLAADVALDRGPVMVSIEYRVPAPAVLEFLELMAARRAERHRGGAYAWGLFEDVAEPGRFVETFSEESWVTHLRHHERVSAADFELSRRIRGLLLHDPRVSHLLAPQVDPLTRG